MEKNIKSRKFVYEIDENISEQINELKNITCKYHIIGFNNENEKYTKIIGYICFQNPRYINSVKKVLGLKIIVKKIHLLFMKELVK